jgi:non-lysosomal glucosylceramidase
MTSKNQGSARPKIAGDASAAAFPLGGIGTGNVSIGARGEFRDWELANHPDKGRSLPFTFFALHVQHDQAPGVTRVLESQLRGPHQFDQGYAAARVAGLPRFAESTMTGRYPLLDIQFEDPIVPVDVRFTAFTPLVPLDPADSGIPAAVLRYTVTNPGTDTVDVTVAGSISNPVGIVDGSDLHMPEFVGHPRIDWHDDGELRGLDCTTDLPADDLSFGSLSLTTKDDSVSAKPRWLVGFWNDGAQRFWDDLRADGQLEPETVFSLDTSPGGFLAIEKPHLTDEELEERLTRLRTGSLAITHRLAPGQTREFEFYLSWSFPNRPRGWRGHIMKNDPHGDEIIVNNYATRFANSWAAASYLATNLGSLEQATRCFSEAIYDGSLPPVVADAIGANIAAARSTTCFVLADGTFAAWEGSFDHAGSCEGTCTHVWNYAQTVAFLFPSLERSARRIEFLLETDETGLMQFRTNQIFGSRAWNMLPAVDGQLGTILRLYREWRFSADDDFLREVWPGATRALDFAFDRWDTNSDYVLDGQQHNTYDIEFYGEDPLGNTLFFAALRAAAIMARRMDDPERAEKYELAAGIGAARMDELLFNGEYYEQRLADVDAHRYQYGSGVLSDQLFGQSLAHLVGLGHVLPVEHVRSALHAVFDHNFRENLSDHHSVQRTYALGDEAGLLLCSWPRGGRPTIPFIYSDEVWTGIEYQVAAHLAYEGFVDEATRVVGAVRARHTGTNRSPWNEPECGNHYARSMASWSLLLAWSGAQWDAPSRALSFSPAEPGAFKSFFSTNGGWGTVRIEQDFIELAVKGGRVDADTLSVRGEEVPLADALRVAAGETFRTALAR